MGVTRNIYDVNKSFFFISVLSNLLVDLRTFNVPIDHLCYSFKGLVRVQQYNTLMTTKVMNLLKSKSIPCYIPKADCEFLYTLIAFSVSRAL